MVEASKVLLIVNNSGTKIAKVKCWQKLPIAMPIIIFIDIASEPVLIHLSIREIIHPIHPYHVWGILA